MTKSKKLLEVDVNAVQLLKDLPELNSGVQILNNSPKKIQVEASISVLSALETVIRQMTVSGKRSRTISDYRLYVQNFIDSTGVMFIGEITAEVIYSWLDGMNVSNQTKLTRLKCLKAFLSKCYDNRWVEFKFWNKITIKVDQKVKNGATEHDVNVLLSLLDFNNFVQLRDAAAILIMFKTGIRINTLVQLEERHIDLENNLLNLDGSIMKNHQNIKLPYDDYLKRLLEVLIKHNAVIKKEYGKDNKLLFITKYGDVISNSPTHNNIQKRLNIYSKSYGLKNINPHALRRGFAKSLLDKGANIAVISKALGHSDLSVTSKYLHLDMDEIVKNLRSFL
ncbi:site-specific integrase [Metabacillus sp. GX 13764]|uniref:tyrosine-type recombinase/integrase n=1 Tax=Metabacillus kandeliae TaxID=2900151 RepID=UPI001E57975C|nr:site-specific integrase [Metabacillus kandeliae]MCD7032855.1 site-specific integrase [Metabacillus kandeliae]